jgi:hypothetical protein
MLYITTQMGFIALTAIFYYLLIREFKTALPNTTLSPDRQKQFINRIIIAVAVWSAAVSVLSLLGVFGNFEIFPLNVGPFLMIPLLTIIIFTFSKTTREVLMHLHPSRIIRLQVFRVFVEILLWLLFIQNLLPVQMSFEGRNFDILAGLTAPIIAYLTLQNKLSKTALIVWNIACLGLLINIVSIAILSMPTPFRYFMNDPANTIVTRFPFVFLPTLLVPLAYMLHFLSLRQLMVKK